MAVSMRSCFTHMEDPRCSRGRRHSLANLMVITIPASICGASGFGEIALWAKAKEKWLRTFLTLHDELPCCDTFARVFRVLNPDAFELCFRHWVKAVAGAITGVLAIDGKTPRGSVDRANGVSAVHLVSAWATANRTVFGQVATKEKSTEITAIPALLKRLDLRGLIVTIDAMGCQKEIAAQIVEQGGDDLLAVKDNQNNLREDIEETFRWGRVRGMNGPAHDHAVSTEKGHGRIERREVTVVRTRSLLRDAAAWKELGCIVEVECQRTVLGVGPEGGDMVTIDRRYFISSVKSSGAEELAAACRAHWGIENDLHWRLDAGFGEDASRVRAGHAAENLSRANRVALNLLTNEPKKASIRSKRLLAGWDHDYLLRVLRTPPD